MPTSKTLQNYADDEASVVLSHCNDVVERGYIRDPHDMYPDIRRPQSISYARQSVPLTVLLLLYERTAVFVPPLSKSDLRIRWNTPLRTVIELAQRDIVIPIIGRPTDYSAAHFDPLLEIRPPSLWARGVALLDRLGMGSALDEDECPLPIQNMAHGKVLRQKYERYQAGISGEELTQRIKGELLLNYADLCIFGEHQLAESFAQYQDPQMITDRLFLANEVRTYPVLFGLGGTANYDRSSLRMDAFTAKTLPTFIASTRQQMVPSNLNVLLRGLGIEISKMRAKDISDFHLSGDGARLRAAVKYFEAEAKKAAAKTSSEHGLNEEEELFEAARKLEMLIAAASKEVASPSFIRQAQRLQGSPNVVLRIGSPALGGWLAQLPGVSVLQGIGGGTILKQLVPAPMRERIVDAALTARFQPGLANLWSIAQRRR